MTVHQPLLQVMVQSEREGVGTCRPLGGSVAPWPCYPAFSQHSARGMGMTPCCGLQKDSRELAWFGHQASS